MQPRPSRTAAMRRRAELRARYARTGDRPIRINDPAGFPVSTPWIAQPRWGFANPGVAWMGPDTVAGLIGWPGETLAAVSRAVELIAGSIAGLPWTVRRSETETVPVPEWIADPQMSRPDNRIASGLGSWQNRLTAMAFREQMAASLLMRGNAYILVPARDAKGAPSPPVFLIHPDDVDIRDGRYYIGSEALPDGSMIHIRGKAPLDEHGRALGVLDAHAADLGLLSAAQRRATDTMNAPIPAGVLEVAPGYTIADDEATGLMADWDEMHAGRYGIAVLNASIAFKPISWSPESLQLIQMAEFGLRNVALAFGLSPSWFGVEDNSLQYSTVVMRGAELRQFTLLPWVRRIESALDAELPRGQELQIVLDGIERGSTQERYNAYATAIQAGFMTPGEARRREGWPPDEEVVDDADA